MTDARDRRPRTDGVRRQVPARFRRVTDRSTTSPRDTAAVDPADYLDPELVEVTRRLLRAIRRTRVDAADRKRAVDAIREAAESLEAEAMDGPFWQTGFTAIEQLDFENLEPLDIFRFSPAIGAGNPGASPVDLRIEDGAVVGTVTFDETKVGPPFDITHGGIIALVYDDVIGLAAMIGAGGGLTASLTIDYRKPTPVFEPIEIRAWFEKADGRKLIARAEMRHDGVLLNEARGLFIQPKGFPAGPATA